MKLYKDTTNDMIISVWQDRGFPVDTASVEKGMSISPLIHALTIQSAIQQFETLHGPQSVLNNNVPLQAPNQGGENFPYNGMLLDEVIVKFCPEAPEEI